MQSFAAMAVGIFDPSTMDFTYSNCGHNPEPYLIRAAESRPLALDCARNIILGAMEEITPLTAKLQLESGDLLFFATDGITEATNAHGEEFETKGLEEFLSGHRELSVNEMVKRLIDDVEIYSQNTVENDDRAVLAFRVR